MRSPDKHRRVWRLTLVPVVACIVCGVLAMILDGPPRVWLAAGSIVLLVTAAYCIGVIGWESSAGPPVDIEESPAEPPVPQSQVALIYDSGTPPNNSLEGDESKATRASG
jgi:hypothetical protein